MIKKAIISTHEVLDKEKISVIPLASFADKLLTVSSTSHYTVSKDGIIIYAGKQLEVAIQKFNDCMAKLPSVEKTFVKSKRLHQLIPG